MVAKDYPDYITPTTNVTVEGLAGLEELAARLKSPAPWDLQGNIFLLEDFETELTEWNDDSAGGVSACSRTTRHKFFGDWSLKMLCDDVVDAKAIHWRELCHPGNTKIALAGMFGWDENEQELQIGLAYSTPALPKSAFLRYRKATTELAILTGDDVWTVVSDTLDLGSEQIGWYPVRLDINLETHEYIKVYATEYVFDVSAYALPTVEHESPKRLMVTLSSRAVGGIGSIIYADGITIARNVS